MNTYVVLCKQGFTLSGQEAILPLEQTYVVAFDPINIYTHLIIIICRLSSCGSSVSQNCTYIQNPSYPTTYTTTGTCAFSVTPLSSGILTIIYHRYFSSSHFFLSFFTEICQLRLDFTNFDIVETTLGVCTDSLTIAGPTGRNPMDLCGTLTGMHGK